MAPTSLRVLLLGAGKRLSLAERLAEAARAEQLELELLSVEESPQVPLAERAAIVPGPAFGEPSFVPFLVELCERERIDLVLPLMDSATVALAGARDELDELGCHAVVSDRELCVAMEDKRAAETWFATHGLPAPVRNGFPRIAKSRKGFGSRDQAVLADPSELERFFADRDPDAYLVQSLVDGPEYTVDAYVARDGRVVGALSRRRLQVVDGEVEVSRSERHHGILELSRRALAVGSWLGPITLQFIDGPDGPVLIEINPRFGGGVTHAIHCGLDSPRWLLREQLGRPVPDFDDWLDGSLMTRCRRDVFHDDPR